MTIANPPETLVEAVVSHRRFLVTSHLNPDGDAIGTSLALARILRAMGKEAAVWLRDPMPPAYRPMPGAAGVHGGAEPPAGFPSGFDLCVVLECPTLDRSGLEALLPRLPLLNIDHHLGNDGYGLVRWVDVTAPAVGEMVLRLAERLGATVDADAATLLHLAIVTDTGGFRFQNATPAAFEACARLVRLGSQPERIAQWLYESQSLGAVRLLGEVLPTLELAADGQVATALLTLEMFERAGAQPGESEGLIDHPRSIAGVEAVALCRERVPGRTKVSLRSRGDVDVEQIARRHGGGGHKNAAGFELAGTPAAVRPAVVAALAEILPPKVP
jgi:phosphoesterase RecJ-like protein